MSLTPNPTNLGLIAQVQHYLQLLSERVSVRVNGTATFSSWSINFSIEIWLLCTPTSSSTDHLVQILANLKSHFLSSYDDITYDLDNQRKCLELIFY
jgi:uncharacterized membrane protein